MQAVLVVGFVLIVILAIAEGTFHPVGGAIMARRARIATQEEWRRQAEADRARWADEEHSWNRRVREAAIKFLADAKDWRDPVGKHGFVQELFGDKVPQYLWYEFSDLTAEETSEICDLFWAGQPSFGDLEGHHNLRVRNAKVFLAEVRLSTGKVLALDQVGYAGYKKFTDELFPTNCVSFSRVDYPNVKTEAA